MNPMELGRNILFSLVLHVTIITAVFTVGGRERVDLVPANYMIVSLFKEMAGITSMASQSTQKGYDKISSIITPLQDEKIREEVHEKVPNAFGITENAEGDTSVIVDRYAGISGEMNISHSATKDNESNLPESRLTPLWKRGAEGELKGGKVGLSGELTSGRNTGFSMIRSSYKGDTNNPYDLIRIAIEKAKDYPFPARRKRIEGTVITEFKIGRSGYPEDIKVKKSSGSEILDSAAIKIVMKAAPFPEVNGKIAVPITFKLTDSP